MNDGILSASADASNMEAHQPAADVSQAELPPRFELLGHARGLCEQTFALSPPTVIARLERAVRLGEITMIDGNGQTIRMNDPEVEWSRLREPPNRWNRRTNRWEKIDAAIDVNKLMALIDSTWPRREPWPHVSAELLDRPQEWGRPPDVALSVHRHPDIFPSGVSERAVYDALEAAAALHWLPLAGRGEDGTLHRIDLNNDETLSGVQDQGAAHLTHPTTGALFIFMKDRRHTIDLRTIAWSRVPGGFRCQSSRLLRDVVLHAPSTLAAMRELLGGQRRAGPLSGSSAWCGLANPYTGQLRGASTASTGVSA